MHHAVKTQGGVARVLDEEKKQVEAGNGAVRNSAGGRARTIDLKARVSVTLESRPRSSSKNIGKISHFKSGLPIRLPDRWTSASRGREVSEPPPHRRGDYYTARFLF
jgi:hypothetical protein